MPFLSCRRKCRGDGRYLTIPQLQIRGFVVDEQAQGEMANMNLSKHMAVVFSAAMFYTASKVVRTVVWVTCILAFTGCVNSSTDVDELRETTRRRACVQMERLVLELTQEMLTSPLVTEVYGKVKNAKGRRPIACIGRIRDAGSASDMEEYFRTMIRVSFINTGLFDVIEVPPPMNITYVKPHGPHYSREKPPDFFVQGHIRNSSNVGCDPSCFLVITLFCSNTGEIVWEVLRQWSGPMP